MSRRGLCAVRGSGRDSENRWDLRPAGPAVGSAASPPPPVRSAVARVASTGKAVCVTPVPGPVAAEQSEVQAGPEPASSSPSPSFFTSSPGAQTRPLSFRVTPASACEVTDLCAVGGDPSVRPALQGPALPRVETFAAKPFPPHRTDDGVCPSTGRATEGKRTSGQRLCEPEARQSCGQAAFPGFVQEEA